MRERLTGNGHSRTVATITALLRTGGIDCDPHVVGLAPLGQRAPGHTVVVAINLASVVEDCHEHAPRDKPGAEHAVQGTVAVRLGQGGIRLDVVDPVAEHVGEVIPDPDHRRRHHAHDSARTACERGVVTRQDGVDQVGTTHPGGERSRQDVRGVAQTRNGRGHAASLSHERRVARHGFQGALNGATRILPTSTGAVDRVGDSLARSALDGLIEEGSRECFDRHGYLLCARAMASLRLG